MLSKEQGRSRRHKRTRKSLIGTSERPRLSVHRSAKNLYIQVIDDIQGRTLASSSTADKKLAAQGEVKGKTGRAEQLGQHFGQALKQKGISKIVFDRGGYPYHGRVKALADSLRQAGLEF